MQILIVAATGFEIQTLRAQLTSQCLIDQKGGFQLGALTIHFLITGVGMVATAFHLGRALLENDYQLVINAGVAGSFTERFPIGSVVQVVSERLGDLGAETADGQFIDLQEMGLQAKDEFPFHHGVIDNPEGRDFQFLPQAKGLTVNRVHGFGESINKIKTKYDIDVESMEGAAVFYACRQMNQAFLEIRSISNFVEPRNKDKWNMPLAIKNLNAVLMEMLEAF